ncbi:MAG TPA: choice-of-anchor Q domain-containing protein [Pyrinomonadaceae bacterium]|nr:choice-of-anchor Q domain-containing protein [Pyrinomonadaceae bacterium]
MSKVFSHIRLFSRIIARAAVCLVALFIFTAMASAASYTVDTTDDSPALTACTSAANDCSLRGAVNNANLASNDTIDFAIPASDPNCPSGVCTISVNEHFVISVAGALTITNSTGANNLLISGNMVSRVFFVFGRSNLTLNGLTMTKGDATGIYASSEDGHGGAIANFGTLTLTDCIVSDNTASKTGGGIYNIGTATLTNTKVTGSIASLEGGGIYNVDRPLTLTGSMVSGNTSRSSGGGIYSSSGTLTLTDSAFSGNSASLNGGGIYNTATTTLTGSSVSGNTGSQFGGGIYSGNTLNLTGSAVSGNTTQFRGGGIYNLGAATLTDSTIDGNRSREAGGGIYSSGTATLTGSTISANRTSGGSSSQFGGGIYNNSGTLTLINSTVSGNIASQVAGGIWNNPGGTLNLTSVTVTLNQSLFTTACTCPGGITNQGTANLNNTIVAGNTVVNASNPPDFNGGISAASSYNLIGIGTNTTGITNGTNGNQVGTAAIPLNPFLAPLANNGGVTRNHALLTGSPAIDKGFGFGLTTDQRGFLRPVDNPSIANATGGDGADIGAFEAQLAPTAAAVSLSGRVMAGSRYVANAVVNLTGSDGVLLTARTNSFGYYRFKNIPSGAVYVVDVTSKSYRFDPRIVNLQDDLDGLDFTAR